MELDVMKESCNPAKEYAAQDKNNFIFCIDKLCLCYGSETVIENVSLNIEKNAVTAVIGPSGCGKTSFLCCLNRLTDLNENCYVSGEIRIGDQNVYGDAVNLVEVRKKIGMLFQKPNLFPFSIWRNLELPLKHHGIKNKNQITEKITKVLKSVSLWDEVKDRLNTPALSLSGGQQQRLCLARALVLEPEVILMDEPCSALDPLSTRKIEELILELKKDYTIIIVTHNIAQAKRISDHVAFFWNSGGKGVLIEQGLTKHIFQNPTNELTAAYINSDY